MGLALHLEDYHPSVLLHCWLGHLTCKIVSKMTYNVSSGTLNPTIPYYCSCLWIVRLISRQASSWSALVSQTSPWDCGGQGWPQTRPYYFTSIIALSSARFNPSRARRDENMSYEEVTWLAESDRRRIQWRTQYRTKHTEERLSWTSSDSLTNLLNPIFWRQPRYCTIHKWTLSERYMLMHPVLELPGDGESPHCGCGTPCNTWRRSLGAFGAIGVVPPLLFS